MEELDYRLSLLGEIFDLLNDTLMGTSSGVRMADKTTLVKQPGWGWHIGAYLVAQIGASHPIGERAAAGCLASSGG